MKLLQSDSMRILLDACGTRDRLFKARDPAHYRVLITGTGSTPTRTRSGGLDSGARLVALEGPVSLSSGLSRRYGSSALAACSLDDVAWGDLIPDEVL